MNDPGGAVKADRGLNARLNRRNVIVAGAVLGAVVGALLGTARPDVYTATAKVFVEPLALSVLHDGTKPLTVNEASKVVLAQEAQIARRETITDRVKRSFPEGSIGVAKVSIGSAGNTLDVSLRASRAEDAADGTNVYVANLISARRKERIASVLDLVKSLESQLTLLDGQIAATNGSERTALEKQRVHVATVVAELSKSRTLITAADIRVLAAAKPPSAPSRKGLGATALVGTLAGGLAGLGVSALIDRRRRRDADFLYLRTGQLTLFGEVSKPYAVESARGEWDDLATTLRLQMPNTGIVLSVCGGGLDHEADIVAVGLASALAQQGVDVAAVDLDLDEPGFARLFFVQGRVGLLDVIRGDAALSTVLQRSDSGVSVVPLGDPRPGSRLLLADRAAGAAVQALSENGRWVILSSPKLEDVPGSTLAATLADGAIVVGRTGQRGLVAVERSVESLRRARVPVLGAVLVRRRVEGDGQSS